MIPTVQLSRSRLETSRLAFGTSRLHHVNHRQRQRLLAAAADAGLVHIDTAPVYGDGLAEREVGAFIKGRRAGIILATKYGILPDAFVAGHPRFALPFGIARAIGHRLGLWPAHERPPLTAEGLRVSVEASLARLRTDYIDLLLLHDPDTHRIPDAPALLGEFGDLRRRGLIRHHGVAGIWGDVADLVPDFGHVVQTGEGEWPAEQPPDISYGAISQARQSAFASAIEPAAALERLQSALQRRPYGVVIVSTRKPERLAELARAAEATQP